MQTLTTVHYLTLVHKVVKKGLRKMKKLKHLWLNLLLQKLLWLNIILQKSLLEHKTVAYLSLLHENHEAIYRAEETEFPAILAK